MGSHKMERRRASWRRGMSTQLVLALLVWAGPSTCLARPHPDSSPDNDTPTRDNTLEMLVFTPRTSQLPSIVVVAGGANGVGGGDDLVNYYLPVFMAEMAAPVSTRDPSIIRVDCRQGFKEDQVGGCRPVFNPAPFYPRSSTRPNRHTSVASILPTIRSPPRVPRPEPQTQRDLIRQFNISRRRPWFGRSLADGTGGNGPSARTGRLVPQPVSTTTVSNTNSYTTTTTTTTTTPSTTTPDCDD